MGLLDADRVRDRTGTVASEVMTPGPSTFRPDVPLEEMLDYMTKRDVEYALVTTPDGVYLGVVYLRDIVSALSSTAPKD
jgi:CBS domain-containing protein